MLFQRLSAAYQALETSQQQSQSQSSNPTAFLPVGTSSALSASVSTSTATSTSTSGFTLRALYDFKGNDKENELSFAKGDTIVVLERNENTGKVKFSFVP